MLIIETLTTLNKNPNTKTTYIQGSQEKRIVTERQYNLTTKDDTLKWFRRLGGSETAQRSYTCYGYKVYKLTSLSPDRQIKKVREYKFMALAYKEQQVFDNLFKSYDNGVFYLKRFKRGLTLNEVIKVIDKKLNR